MANIPYEIYKELEESLGKEKAERLTKAFEKYFETQKEEIKIKLKEELRNELATKEDIEVLRAEIRRVEQVLDLRMKVWFILVIALILFTNRETLEWLFKLLGLIK